MENRENSSNLSFENYVRLMCQTHKISYDENNIYPALAQLMDTSAGLYRRFFDNGKFPAGSDYLGALRQEVSLIDGKGASTTYLNVLPDNTPFHNLQHAIDAKKIPTEDTQIKSFFTGLDKDLKDRPDWEAFWAKISAQNQDDLPKTDAIHNMQQQILASFRFRAFALLTAHALTALPTSSPEYRTIAQHNKKLMTYNAQLLNEAISQKNTNTRKFNPYQDNADKLLHRLLASYSSKTKFSLFGPPAQTLLNKKRCELLINTIEEISRLTEPDMKNKIEQSLAKLLSDNKQATEQFAKLKKHHYGMMQEQILQFFPDVAKIPEMSKLADEPKPLAGHHRPGRRSS